ncbi:MAG TPA: NAD-dependent epimerase/dehydratase family protein [Candidatus Aenigmarchaeota archaeon]|nr:NAD-dependent epimerase/dehydratase family protein [Candidatus Aenigmarchaeota archaeon]
MDWNGVRALVTGADGFMGSHLTEKLVSMGADVSVYVRGNSQTGTVQYKLKNIGHIKDKLKTIITGNISNSDSIKLIEKNNPQVIFHLAADAYVPNSFEHPLEVMETNLIGTLNVLHAVMRLHELQQVVCTSSSEIYGTAQYAPIDEKHPLNPTSPYAASKAAADRYCFAYWNTYKLPIAIIRPFNTYGPRHTYDVIPKFIKLALQGKDLTVYGSGNQSRDFTYIDDMVNAFILMGSENKAIGEFVNFGTSVDVSINEVAKKIIAISSSKSKVVHHGERLAEVNRLCCDYNKAKKLFGWEPLVDIDEGLRRNIEWDKAHVSN